MAESSYQPSLRERGRPDSVPVPESEAPVMQQRRPRSAERQIDISFIGMNHLFDTPAPYDSVTIDHLNLEPHRGGYRPRYDDEVLIAETNAQMRPFGCIAAGNHLFFLPRFFLKTAPQPETKPLEWFYYTLRGNAAYIPIDDNVLLSVRYLGTVVSWDSANNKLTLKSDTDDIFMEEKGGFILANRNVYRFSSATLNPDGSLVLDGVTPVLAPYASICVSDRHSNRVGIPEPCRTAADDPVGALCREFRHDERNRFLLLLLACCRQQRSAFADAYRFEPLFGKPRITAPVPCL